MANTKISALTNGNPAVGTDTIPIDRAGVNRSLTAASIAALAQATSPQTVGSSQASGLSANVSTVTLFTVPVTGMYALDYEVECSTAATSGASATLGFQWKMNGGVTSQSQTAVALNTIIASGQAGLRKNFWLTAGDVFQFFINYVAGSGPAPVYRYSLVATRLL